MASPGRRLGEGVDPTWEQVRAQHLQLFRDAQNRYHRTLKFEPGQIALCNGSIEAAFWHFLIRIGINIAASEMPVMLEMPKRWCIVNRHLTGQIYEVFLLTTFGGARNYEELGVLARNFGLPMGGTKWFDNIPGLTTIPPIFGSDKTSFVFAIPVTHVIGPSNLPPTTRLPPVELDRLRDFSLSKLKMLTERHDEIRKKVRIWRANKNYSGRASLDQQDQFKPERRTVPISLEDHDDMQDFTADSTAIYSSRFRPSYLNVPARSDISWILRHIDKDFNISKSLVQLPPLKPRRVLLPKPYFAPLPISLAKVLRSIL